MQSLFWIEIKGYHSDHGLRTPIEEISFTARPKIHYHSQFFKYGWSIFCQTHWPIFSDIFDLCLHWVPVVCGLYKLYNIIQQRGENKNDSLKGLYPIMIMRPQLCTPLEYSLGITKKPPFKFISALFLSFKPFNKGGLIWNRVILFVSLK